MKSNFFIERPIFSIVLSMVIVILGLIGILQLPIDQYPQITPPVVKISCSYPGASSQTVAQAVATPIEQQLNGTPGMLYMESNSSNTGSLSISITFDIDIDPDLAAIEIQNRVKLAESRLPAEVVENGITVEKQSASQLMTVCLTSSDPKFDEIYLSNFATINVIDPLKRVDGIGRISNIGSRYYGMCIWVEPDKLASFGLTVKDLQSAIKEQNRESAAGTLGMQPTESQDLTIPITAPGRLSSASEFEQIVIRANGDGSIIRLKDVARVSLEASSYSTESGLDGANAAMLAIYMLPGANAVGVSEQVKATMKEISKSFPEGLDYDITFDVTDYINDSIHEVYKTLLEALILVVIVVFFSLQNWRTAIIPLIAVPISLIGTFGVMLLFGFSLNMLTLLGLILAIGIVVDDAIVVVEAVESYMTTENLSAKAATTKAMKSLSGALIATTMVLVAVFLPVSFLPGISGVLYQQFAITIVVSVIISTVVALTLSPALCGMMLKPSEGKKWRVFNKINLLVDNGNHFYVNWVKKFISHPKRTFSLFGMILIAIFVLNRVIATGFIPQEDQGYFKVELELAQGATLERTREVANRAILFLNQHPSVAHVQHVVGSSPRRGTSQASSELTVILKPWTDRSKDGFTVDKVIEEIRSEFNQYPEAKCYIIRPSVIPGLGGAGGLEMFLEAKGETTQQQLRDAVDTLLYYTKKEKSLAAVSTSLQHEIPQLHYAVDRDRAKFLGIPMTDIFSTMKAYTGSVYVNDFNLFNRVYKVYIQAEAPYRSHKSDIALFHVRAANGQMVPLTAVGEAHYTTGSGTITRFNMFLSAKLQGEVSMGYSTGDAIKAIEKIVDEHLPENIAIEWSGLSYQEKKASGSLIMVIGLVLLFVFLFLAAQYESWSVPIAIILSLPIAALGAYLGIGLLGLENNVFFQIGLVTLVGLSAKNGILIVEYAQSGVENGMTARKAAIKGAESRFRPIVMTSLAFVLGMVPLVIASGPGSAGRLSIGCGIFFGMIAAITIGIVLVPFFFCIIYEFKQRRK